MPSLLKRLPLGAIVDVLMPVLAVLGALLVGALMLIALGANPVEAYGALLEGAFGSANAIAETAVKATPLLLVGLGICISFRANVINIGGEGQMVVGALFAVAVALAVPNLLKNGRVPQVHWAPTGHHANAAE